MSRLPIHNVIADIQAALLCNNKLVLQAAPGAGKTTIVPLELLNQEWLKNKQIIMLEPRRLAARNAAARMASLLNEKVGETVGYQIKQDKCVSNKTRILVLTEGILTRKLQADPEQKNTALIIFDEFHERSIHGDLSLALSLQSQEILNDELKILIMSATLNTQGISALLDNAPIIQSEGRSYPVDIHYLDKSIPSGKPFQLIDSLLESTKHVIKQHNGSCLIFLPGVKEINQLAEKIKYYIALESLTHIDVACLFGNLNKQQQDQAIAPSPNGHRKIVLATNIAETSLTIDGISCVIDSGLERFLEFSPASAMNKLKTQFISNDSATQRAGRAGRLSAGTCYRLWTASDQKRLLKHAAAEITHSDLCSFILELSYWGVHDVNELKWMDIPPSSAIQQARDILFQLNAIDAEDKITSHGKQLLTLAAHPRLAHMMLSSIELSCPYQACLLASLLTEKDIFIGNYEKSTDLNDRLSSLDHFIKTHRITSKNINKTQCQQIIRSADDLYKRLKYTQKFNDNKNITLNLSGVLLAFSYPDRISKQRKNSDGEYLLSNGKGARIPDYFQQHFYEYTVIANLDAKNSNGLIYLDAEINEDQLDHYFSHLISKHALLSWNEKSLRVDAKQTKNIGKITLTEKTIIPDDKTAVHNCLINAIKKLGIECLNWSDLASNLVQRIEFIQLFITNNESSSKNLLNLDLPNLSFKILEESLETWLLPHLNNENSIKHCQKLDLFNILHNQLSWQQQQTLKELAPEKIKVPSGSYIKIDYQDSKQPILAVRLQEVFGLYDTPTLLNGQVQLMMHLLSPARKPMQVTQDLHSFWETTYHDVKKELRGKYKRHYWPDDPFTAQATNKTKKNMHR